MAAKLNHVQFFATGSAANEFAKREEVCEVAFQYMAPSAAALTRLEINQDSLKAIESSLNISASNVPLILIKAKALGLIEHDDNLSKEEIMAALTKKIIANNYLITSKLYTLKKLLP